MAEQGPPARTYPDQPPETVELPDLIITPENLDEALGTLKQVLDESRARKKREKGAS